MTKATKRPSKTKSHPTRMSTKELCLSLVSIAAFHVEDDAAQKKIYEAVRRLEALDSAAIAAGLISEQH